MRHDTSLWSGRAHWLDKPIAGCFYFQWIYRKAPIIRWPSINDLSDVSALIFPVNRMSEIIDIIIGIFSWLFVNGVGTLNFQCVRGSKKKNNKHYINQTIFELKTAEIECLHLVANIIRNQQSDAPAMGYRSFCNRCVLDSECNKVGILPGEGSKETLMNSRRATIILFDSLRK